MIKKQSLMSFIKTYSGLSSAIYVLFIARIINRMGDFVHLFMTLYLTRIMGFEVRPASRSMLTDLSKAEERHKAFSLLYLGTNFGVAIGPMIAGFLFRNHLPWIFNVF